MLKNIKKTRKFNGKTFHFKGVNTGSHLKGSKAYWKKQGYLTRYIKTKKYKGKRYTYENVYLLFARRKK